MKIVFALLMLLFATGLFSQTKRVVNKPGEKKTKAIYLDKKDSIFIIIQHNIIADLKKSAGRSDGKSPEGKLRAEEMKSWSEEKLNRYQELFESSVRKYVKVADFNFDTFLLLFMDFAANEDSVLATFDLRVQASGTHNLIAEFWEDLLLANSEENALIWAKKILERYPDDDSTSTVNTVKETYAAARKAILDGKNPRFSKIMALLYTKENETIVFKDPFQDLIDFRYHLRIRQLLPFTQQQSIYTHSLV